MIGGEWAGAGLGLVGKTAVFSGLHYIFLSGCKEKGGMAGLSIQRTG